MRALFFVFLALPGTSAFVAPLVRKSGHRLRAAEGTTDIVVVGSGIGGLCAGALLEKLGYSVTVVESHDRVGGCAHGFERKTKEGVFNFDSGPSLFSGCSAPSSNPLRQILDAVGVDDLDWKTYKAWALYFPDGKDFATFRSSCGDAKDFGEELAKFGGPQERIYWKRLLEVNENLGHVIGALPPIVLRPDPIGAVQTAAPYLKRRLDPLKFAKFGLSDLPFLKLDPSGPFSNLLEAAKIPKTSMTYRWFDFLAFALSGLPATATSAAACSFMIKEFFSDNATMEYPVGGSQAIADSLAKKCGTVLLKSHVTEILVDEQHRASGVRLADNTIRHATVAVISNAGVWNTEKLIKNIDIKDIKAPPPKKTPPTPSFMHLHVAFAAKETDASWNHTMHHIIVNDWNLPIDAEDNLVFIAIPSVLDPTAAPTGYHTLHAYLPATEPYERWQNLDRKSQEYKSLKEKRSGALWRAVERFIPDIKDRQVLSMAASPLTHERYTRRYQGTYGPAWQAGKDSFPGHASSIPRLFCCGDSTFPGIGVPAVAGSAIAAAFSIASVTQHKRLLKEMDDSGTLPL